MKETKTTKKPRKRKRKDTEVKTEKEVSGQLRQGV
jgi:hypothetical protein